MRDLDGFRQFDALARALHFGRAAREVHLSTSALSRAIQRLERDAGTPLVERTHHQVTLTAAGEAFWRTAREVLETWDRFEAQRAGDRAELSGTLHLYCTVTAAQSLVPELLGRFRLAHPGVRLALETGYAADALQRVRSSTIDAAVAPLPVDLPAGLRSDHLTTTPIVFVGPTEPGPIETQLRRRPRDWSAVPLVVPAHGLVRQHLDDWLASADIEPTIYAAIEGHEAILSLVAMGCGVGVVPRLVLESSALRDRVKVVPTRQPIRPLDIGLCTRARSSSPLVAALIEAGAAPAA